MHHLTHKYMHSRASESVYHFSQWGMYVCPDHTCHWSWRSLPWYPACPGLIPGSKLNKHGWPLGRDLGFTILTVYILIGICTKHIPNILPFFEMGLPLPTCTVISYHTLSNSNMRVSFLLLNSSSYVTMFENYKWINQFYYYSNNLES